MEQRHPISYSPSLFGPQREDVVAGWAGCGRACDDPGLGVLAYMSPLTTHLSGLQPACADQGITIVII